MNDDVDPDAHTRLAFTPTDAEPTGRAEAWSGEQAIEDYPYGPESAPTMIVKEAAGNSMMIGMAILVAAVMIFAGFMTVAMTGRDSSTTTATTPMVQATVQPTTPIRIPPPVTVTVTPPPSTSTVVVPAPVPPPQSQSTACQRLQSQANVDAETTSNEAMHYWVPQLSSKRPGLVADGITWDCDSILAEHMGLRNAYGANLLWSGDWPHTFGNDDYWVTVASYIFPTADGARQWCVDHGRDVPEHCYPTQIR